MTFSAIKSSLTNFVADATYGMRKSHAESALKKYMLSIREAAKEYERAKLPAGHEFYVKLYDQATAAIQEFCSRWAGEDPVAVQMKFPFLHSLNKKAHPDAVEATSNTGYAVFGVIAVILFCALLGAAFGFGQGICHVVKGWFGA